MTYRSFIARVMPTVLRGPIGRRFIGTFALFFDLLAEGARQAVRAPWVGDASGVGPAYDGMTASGNEVSLMRYPGETWAQHHARLQRVWDDYPLAGTEGAIAAQLSAAGFPGAVFYYDPPNTAFWIFFPAGTHTVTAQGPLVGSFVVGDGTLIGPVGITPGQITTMRGIIARWKPAHWVCTKIIFQLTGWTVGDGHHVGDVGLTLGGENVIISAA